MRMRLIAKTTAYWAQDAAVFHRAVLLSSLRTCTWDIEDFYVRLAIPIYLEKSFKSTVFILKLGGTSYLCVVDGCSQSFSFAVVSDFSPMVRLPNFSRERVDASRFSARGTATPASAASTARGPNSSGRAAAWPRDGWPAQIGMGRELHGK